MAGTDDIDLADLILEAHAEAQAIFREITLELAGGAALRATAMLWAQLTAEQREQFKKDRPQQYAALAQMLKLNRQ